MSRPRSIWKKVWCCWNAEPAGEGAVPSEAETEVSVLVGSDADIIIARQQGRALAEKAGFSGSDLTLLETAISRVGRNIVEQARSVGLYVGIFKHGETR